ncbi:hypothetical protein FACS1894111_04080 [Clostridia bacterium]|nr:hypothetical protein FACS1894111_04080 [Clostridia bacterium]
MLKRIGVLTCLGVMLSYATVYAATTYSFTYNFKHQLSVSGTQKATQSSANFNIYTTTNGSSENWFDVKQFKPKLIGSDEYITSRSIDCKVNSSGSCSFPTTTGTSYSYEFWKPVAVGQLIGSGTLKY